MNCFKHSNFSETDSCKAWYLVYRLAASGLNQVVKSTMSHLDMTMAVATVIWSTSHVLWTWKQDLIFWVWLLIFNLVSHSIHSMYVRSAVLAYAISIYKQKVELFVELQLQVICVNCSHRAKSHSFELMSPICMCVLASEQVQLALATVFITKGLYAHQLNRLCISCDLSGWLACV